MNHILSSNEHQLQSLERGVQLPRLVSHGGGGAWPRLTTPRAVRSITQIGEAEGTPRRSAAPPSHLAASKFAERRRQSEDVLPRTDG